MINLLASVLVWLTGLYLIGFAVGLLLLPARATQYLGGFASSGFYPLLGASDPSCRGCGNLAIRTAAVVFQLLCHFWLDSRSDHRRFFAVPWQWHRRFAQWGVPYATRNLKLVAGASFVFGGFVLAFLILGGTHQ